MEHQIKREPQFWINPNFRLNSPHFRFAWFMADMTVLRQEAMIMSVERKVYQTSKQCVVCVITPDHSSLDIVYADKTKFDNLRLQKWLRETIREDFRNGCVKLSVMKLRREPRLSFHHVCENWKVKTICMATECLSRSSVATLWDVAVYIMT